MSLKKAQVCPVCRAPIKNTVRSIVLDSYIDKMVEHLSDDLKELRKKLIAERDGKFRNIEIIKDFPCRLSPLNIYPQAHTIW